MRKLYHEKIELENDKNTHTHTHTHIVECSRDFLQGLD